MYHSWQAFVVKSSIQTVERAGLLNQLSGRSNDVANQSGIISVVSNCHCPGIKGCFLMIRYYNPGQKSLDTFAKNLANSHHLVHPYHSTPFHRCSGEEGGGLPKPCDIKRASDLFGALKILFTNLQFCAHFTECLKTFFAQRIGFLRRIISSLK